MSTTPPAFKKLGAINEGKQNVLPSFIVIFKVFSYLFFKASVAMVSGLITGLQLPFLFSFHND